MRRIAEYDFHLGPVIGINPEIISDEQRGNAAPDKRTFAYTEIIINLFDQVFSYQFFLFSGGLIKLDFLFEIQVGLRPKAKRNPHIDPGHLDFRPPGAWANKF
jgi:hypothetical protein